MTVPSANFATMVSFMMGKSEVKMMLKGVLPCDTLDKIERVQENNSCM